MRTGAFFAADFLLEGVAFPLRVTLLPPVLLSREEVFLVEVFPFLLAADFLGLEGFFFPDGSLLAMQRQAPMGHPIIQPAFVPEPQETRQIDGIYRRESIKRSIPVSGIAKRPRRPREFHKQESESS